jgi:hypothetical protein
VNPSFALADLHARAERAIDEARQLKVARVQLRREIANRKPGATPVPKQISS